MRCLVWWVGFALLIAVSGCAPISPALPVETLPAPKVHLTTVPDGPISTPKNLAAATWAAPTRAAAAQGSLAEIARSEYGERLVTRIRIPSLNIDAPVVPVGWQSSDSQGEVVEWESPDASVGWAVSSALPDQAGNVILYGHNNLHSNVFMHLSDLKNGAVVTLETGQGEYHYRVTGVEILAVSNREEDRAAYQQVFQSTESAQLTLITCWPPVSNTHRVIVTGVPQD